MTAKEDEVVRALEDGIEALCNEGECGETADILRNAISLARKQAEKAAALEWILKDVRGCQKHYFDALAADADVLPIIRTMIEEKTMTALEKMTVEELRGYISFDDGANGLDAFNELARRLAEREKEIKDFKVTLDWCGSTRCSGSSNIDYERYYSISDETDRI